MNRWKPANWPGPALVMVMACVLLLVDGALSTAMAQGLSVAPSRVVFEDGERSTRLLLHNGSSAPMTYRLHMIRARMDDDGRMSVIDPSIDTEPAEGELFADDLIQFSPRQVTLRPGETQTVRMMVRAPAELADGEYRAHLQFQALPRVQTPSPEMASQEDFAVAVQMLQHLTIPVILRRGELTAQVQVNAALEAGEDGGSQGVAVELHRSGQRSVYGNIVVSRLSVGGERTVLLERNGVAVYVPNEVRRIVLPLAISETSQATSGRLEISFQEVRDERPRSRAIRSVID